MSYALKIHSEAVIDIQESFERYQIQQTGLGFEFIEEIENRFTKICEHPKYYTSINKCF
jgi:hypothetical protein